MEFGFKNFVSNTFDTFFWLKKKHHEFDKLYLFVFGKQPMKRDYISRFFGDMICFPTDFCWGLFFWAWRGNASLTIFQVHSKIVEKIFPGFTCFAMEKICPCFFA